MGRQTYTSSRAERGHTAASDHGAAQQSALADGVSGDGQADELHAAGGDAWDALRWARTQSTATLNRAPVELLTLRASALDAALLGGEWRGQPELERRVARTLVGIYDAMCARPVSELGELRDPDSPLDGLVDDVPPFAHRDLWSTFLHRPPAPRPAPEPEPAPGPEPDPRPAEPDVAVPEGDIGDETGDRLGGAGERLPDPGRGPSAADLTQSGLDLVGMFVENAVMETLGVLSAVYSFWAHFGTLEQAAQQERGAMSAWGVRHGIIALDLMPPPYPDVMTKEDLRAVIEHTREWERDWNLVAYPITGPEVHAALLRGLAQVATAVTRAFARFDARVRAAATTASAEAMHTALANGRARIVDEIVERARSRFSESDAARP